MGGSSRSTGSSRRERRRASRQSYQETAAGRDQEAEVRARLYAKPLPTERTVEILGPVPQEHRHRPAA